MITQSNTRLIKNTLYLYIRQAISMLISFFTVGVTLDILGIEDYGINSVVSGAVSMFSFLTGAMAIGNQRFYSFYLGTGEYTKLRQIVGCTFTVYIGLIIVLLILCESIGLWMLNNYLVIPPHRLHAANIIFQIGLISMAFGLMQAPLVGLITAHEDMSVYAKMTIVDSILRLAYLYLLVKIPYDKLIVYSTLALGVSVLVTTIYLGYCLKHYKESHTWPLFNKEILKELLGFNVWNLCGNFAWMLKNQGTAFILNIFFGPTVNAAQNIATTVRGVSSTFAGGVSSAVRPQITKSYAVGNHDHMFKLTFGGAKIMYILMAIVVIPAILNIPLILDLWLPKVPDYTIIFCQLMLIEILIEQTGSLLASITQATGKIRNYQLLIGLFGALNIPFSFLALWAGCSPTWVYIISIVCQLGVNAVRVIFLSKVRKDAVKLCIKDLIIPCSLAALAGGGVCFMFPRSSQLSIAIPIIILEIGIVGFLGYFIAFNPNERAMVKQYILDFKNKIKNK